MHSRVYHISEIIKYAATPLNPKMGLSGMRHLSRSDGEVFRLYGWDELGESIKMVVSVGTAWVRTSIVYWPKAVFQYVIAPRGYCHCFQMVLFSIIKKSTLCIINSRDYI